MKNLNGLDRYRRADLELQVFGQRGNSDNGIFIVRYEKVDLRVFATSGSGWEHVSVSLGHRSPKWEEMSFIYKTFFRDHEVVMQLHVPAKDHVNNHENCLHLWRPRDDYEYGIPLPPKELV